VQNKGSLKRCGGMGDILSGIITSYSGMLMKAFGKNITNLDLMEACAVACFLTRELSYKAYEKYTYSLTAPDVIAELKNYIKTYNLKISN
jgi:NAD(P)H-hydrate repair Nnr-like enzyme with NAD(P)H-hydrate dehydratase domain